MHMWPITAMPSCPAVPLDEVQQVQRTPWDAYMSSRPLHRNCIAETVASVGTAAVSAKCKQSFAVKLGASGTKKSLFLNGTK